MAETWHQENNAAFFQNAAVNEERMRVDQWVISLAGVRASGFFQSLLFAYQEVAVDL